MGHSSRAPHPRQRGRGMSLRKTGWAALDLIAGRRGIERRIKKGERISVVIYADIDPDVRAHSDDGTSTQFGLVNVRWAEAPAPTPEEQR